MTVPKLEPVREFAPSLALVGPAVGFAEIEDHTGSVVSYSVPFKIPEGTDAVVAVYSGQIPSPEFYEPFTQTTYWERQQIVIESLPATGTYYLESCSTLDLARARAGNTHWQ